MEYWSSRTVVWNFCFFFSPFTTNDRNGSTKTA